MANIAILGFGVVGGGIALVVDENKDRIKKSAGEEVYVKYVLDLREFPDSPYADRVIHDIGPILADDSVTVVCEAMGGTKPALDFSLRALRAGKSVVTSNKELVAKHGDELLAAARENGVCYLYEAAVGGGIPALRSLKTSLASDKISRVAGILNGTTNYILTRMKNEGGSFDDALAEAKSLGYAEADPTADVDGLDAQRKIMILSAIASGKLAPESAVKAETLRNVSELDLNAAENFGGTVKLIGLFENGDKPCLGVAPFFVMNDNILAHVDDVFNAVCATGAATGDVMYYGRGAGRYPTAAAMVSDVCAAINGSGRLELPSAFEKIADDGVKPFDELPFRRMIRVKCSAASAAQSAREIIENAFELDSFYAEDEVDFCALTTDAIEAAELAEVIGAVEAVDGVEAGVVSYRVLE